MRSVSPELPRPLHQEQVRREGQRGAEQAHCGEKQNNVNREKIDILLSFPGLPLHVVLITSCGAFNSQETSCVCLGC